MHSTSF